MTSTEAQIVEALRAILKRQVDDAKAIAALIESVRELAVQVERLADEAGRPPGDPVN
ncbi:MAG: hypothetical protein OXH70_19255 [Acidobacteria bacterium]|nr:hypothetical protein [Acidobacteriota bacterium]MCY3968380.1 hypothetical protein [Acidobacteriota bacterium]